LSKRTSNDPWGRLELGHGRQLRIWGGLLSLLLVLIASAAHTAPAFADGDPGSDVLVYQQLFLAADAGISTTEQVRLGSLLSSVKRAGFPVRVAIIANPSDLGSVTPLWRRPRVYASYLGYEISLAYSGPLVIVMPNGIGFNWPRHSAADAYRILDRIPVHPGGAGLAAAAQAAVIDLAATVHVRVSGAGTKSEPAPTPRHRVSSGATAESRAKSPAEISRSVGKSSSAGVLAAIALLALAAAAIVVRKKLIRNRSTVNSGLHTARPLLTRSLSRRALLSGTSAVFVVAVVAVALIALPGSSPPIAAAAFNNHFLDSGTALSRPAPNFTLTDQFGRQVSLKSFRGKVVILAFNDSECTTMCPLTTTAMLDAKAMLGSAASHIQLLGVDANPKATAIEDVLSYSQLHGMLHSWDFLTAGLPQLKRVWKAYSIDAEITQKTVDHTPAIYVISPSGRVADLFETQQSYAAVGQLGQLIAKESASLLPGNPPVHSHLNYQYIPGIPPTTSTSVPKVGGGKLALGPGQPRLLLFFATWDKQITGLAGGLDGLNKYEALAAREHLPKLVAIDEGIVEPPGALASFMPTIRTPLSYPVGVDPNGRLSDGYEVLGQPWLMLVNSTGHIASYYSVAALGWPSASRIAHSVRRALALFPASGAKTATATSPPALTAVHEQAARLLGSYPALAARIRRLRGYPVVVNVWASWCTPCQAEFGFFANMSLRYGDRVAFLGADDEDSAANARSFLEQHHVSYPSYSVSSSELSPLAQIEGLPTTIFIGRSGKVAFVHTGQYASAKALQADISGYANPWRQDARWP
jgi:cytochrome oxidase Cu insertion factor (SCO1/SenC/PrrC family)/thiol-disulfide isomerase/thioredoxin